MKNLLFKIKEFIKKIIFIKFILVMYQLFSFIYKNNYFKNLFNINFIFFK